MHNFSPLTWPGFFLKSVDGSTVKLPNYPGIADHFGTWDPRQGAPVPMARVSQMFDPLNNITTHAMIGPKTSGEREMAASHFEHLNNRDLVLLDRGYPAFWLFKLITSRNADFCSRVSTKKWKIIRKFVKSGKDEQLVTLKAPSTSIGACRERHLDVRPMPLRLVRIELDSGETEVLITSLSLRWPLSRPVAGRGRLQGYEMPNRNGEFFRTNRINRIPRFPRSDFLQKHYLHAYLRRTR